MFLIGKWDYLYTSTYRLKVNVSTKLNKGKLRHVLGSEVINVSTEHYNCLKRTKNA